jgi:hypothetical protein
MSATKPSQPSRVTNVQMPGAQPPPAPPVEQTPSPAQIAAIDAAAADQRAKESESAKGNINATEVFTAASLGDVDMEALRAHIREEERALIRAEFAEHSTAAKSKAVTEFHQAQPRSKAEYRNMRAADIDHTTLTAPVMTLDGYLCPPAPEAKK